MQKGICVQIVFEREKKRAIEQQSQDWAIALISPFTSPCCALHLCLGFPAEPHSQVEESHWETVVVLLPAPVAAEWFLVVEAYVAAGSLVKVEGSLTGPSVTPY
jgi:hypothetical protein